jgi:hypothetical protein
MSYCRVKVVFDGVIIDARYTGVATHRVASSNVTQLYTDWHAAVAGGKHKVVLDTISHIVIVPRMWFTLEASYRSAI